MIINIDLKDFFPSINSFQVVQVFHAFTRSIPFAEVLTILTTDIHRVSVIRDGEQLNYCVGPRFLPQGAPTSPALSNFVFYNCDVALSNYCSERKIVYSRYADDLTFSFTDSQINRTEFFRDIFQIVRRHYFKINTDKISVLSNGCRKVVTGLVVNEGVHASKVFHIRLRGLIH